MKKYRGLLEAVERVYKELAKQFSQQEPTTPFQQKDQSRIK